MPLSDQIDAAFKSVKESFLAVRFFKATKEECLGGIVTKKFIHNGQRLLPDYSEWGL